MPRYDEHDPESYERPRRRTRPRTKDRPSYDDAVAATVVTVDRGRITCRTDDGTIVTAMKSRPLGRKAAVVGDRVGLVGDISGAEGSLARIVTIEPRTTVLRRTADDDDPVERVVVANADQLVIVAALADPEPRPRLIDRALVAAYVAGMEPLLCLTKSDLASPDERQAATRWWLDLTAGGGEGMVVKPAHLTEGRIQPGIKVRGREYLRIIYGPDYTDSLDVLRGRQLGKKRQLALREHGLGLEALSAFVGREPLWKVHQAVFAVLALESEPVDPRL